MSTPPSLPPLNGKGSIQIEHRLILLSPEFLLHKHYLFLLKLGTSGCLAFGLHFRSADSSGERQQTQTEASIPFYFVLSLSSLPWAGIPGIFEEIHPSGTVGWGEFWQCMLSKGMGFAVANIVCLQHKIVEVEALSHPWSDDPRLSRVSCLQVFWKLLTDTNISSSYSHSHYCEFNPSKSSTFSVNGQTYTLSYGSPSLSMVLEYDTVTVSVVLTSVEALWFAP